MPDPNRPNVPPDAAADGQQNVGLDVHQNGAPDAQARTSPPRWVTYAELANLLDLRPAAARARAKRRKLPTRIGEDGKAQVLVDATILAERLGERLGERSAERSDERTGYRLPERSGGRPDVSSVGQVAEVARLQVDLARAQAERDGALTRLTDKIEEVARLTGIIERRDREVERRDVLLQQLQARLPELPAPAEHRTGLVERVRRWFGGRPK